MYYVFMHTFSKFHLVNILYSYLKGSNKSAMVVIQKQMFMLFLEVKFSSSSLRESIKRSSRKYFFFAFFTAKVCGVSVVFI